MTMQRALIPAALTALAAAALLFGCGNPADTPVPVPVPAPIAVTGVALDASSFTIYSHESRDLVAAVSPADAADKNLAWTSGDGAVADVDSNGKVSAKGVGTTTITATTSDGGYTASCVVTVVPHVYVLGSVYTGTDYAAGYWKDEAWIDLPGPEGSTDCEVRDIAVTDGKVYTGGNYQAADGTLLPAYWIDNALVELSSPWPGKYARIFTIAAADGHVYAGGCCHDETDWMRAGYWLDGVWHSLTLGEADGPSAVLDIAVSDGKVYASGYKNYLPGYWVDDAWTQLSDDIHNRASGLVVAGGSVYVGGIDSTGTSIPCYWKDGVRTDLPIEPGWAGTVESLTFFDGKLCAAGLYRNTSTYQNVPVYWVDGERRQLEPLAAGKSASSLYIASSGNSLYFTLVGSDAEDNWRYGVLKDGTWAELPPPGENNTDSINGILVD